MVPWHRREHRAWGVEESLRGFSTLGFNLHTSPSPPSQVFSGLAGILSTPGFGLELALSGGKAISLEDLKGIKRVFNLGFLM